jgi:hypothetical protein
MFLVIATTASISCTRELGNSPMDVKLVFLNGVLNKEIYMEENKVCCLKKAIYGLKQASPAWNQQFHGVLIELARLRANIL